MGNLWLAGFNGYGQLGDNTITSVSSPIQTITGGNDWTYVSKSWASNTAALKKDGTLWLWGEGNRGVLGDNSTSNRSSPVQTVTGGTNWTAVSMGNYCTYGIKSDGTLWSWGADDYGKLGHFDVADISSPVQVYGSSTDWASVSAGGGHAVAIKTDGTLWGWGNNYYGQLGTNNTTNVSSPVQTICLGTNWSSVSAGFEMTAAIKKDGTLWCWGNNGYGQLGNNSTVKVSSPIQTISGGSNWSKLSAGTAVGAIKTDGTLWMWGRNTTGMLGDETIINRSSPIQTIAGGTNWSHISVNLYGTGAIKTDNTMWRWGANYAGEIGDETTTAKSSPVQTVAISTMWSTVEVGTTELKAIEASSLQLQIATAPAYIYSQTPFGAQPVINIVDGMSVVDPTATDAVTVSVAAGNASISGTTTVNAIAGVVTYSDLVLTGYGPVTLQFTATGITSTSITINVEIAGAVLPKRSETASSVPTSGQLLVGELAINITDKKGYVKKSDGTIVNVFTSQPNGGFY